MQLITNNKNDEIKTFFEEEVSVHPVAWRSIHFFWEDMSPTLMKDLKGFIGDTLPQDPEECLLFKWGKKDIFILCKGVRREPLDEAVKKIRYMYNKNHTLQKKTDNTFDVSVYDLSIAWNDFREFFHFREKEILQESSESIRKEEEEIKLVYEEPKPNPILIRERAERPGITVLIVDEDEAMLRLLGSVLKSYKVVRAKDGRDALEKYYETAPDIVFLETELPHLSGWDIMERVYEHDKNGYVVMVTANTQSDDVQKAIRLGVKGYIKKPFSAAKIQQYVDKFVESAPKHKQIASVV